ncbi:MAG TPA: IS21 family transposase [Acetobacteraceae bacterium]|nr:IS21 family transposase [Acetobacteraceae bacterium]
MTITPDLEAQILRYYHVERWRIGTIARQLHVHHGTVARVLAQAGLPRIGPPARRSRVEPYLPFIHQTLEKFPTLTASRLYAMVCERGYRGSGDHFRHLIACYRPRPAAQAYLRLRSLPGEQAQVDWAHFGHLVIGRARRPLMAFVMVLSHSRQIFLRFFLDARMENFLRGHVAAFEAWQGVPRVLLYDNLKTAVLERRGDAIRFHPTLLSFAGHYRYEPRPVAVARGNEKGRVERAIRYVRDGFFAARTFTDLDDLNAQAEAWCNGLAADRRCPEDLKRSVREVFAEEAPRLLPLPDNPAPLLEHVAVSVGKTPYVRFDLNTYSVPHTHVRRVLTVLADPHEVRVVDGGAVLARHPRSYDRDAQIEQAGHVEALEQQKRAARQHRATDRLVQAAPASQTLLIRAAERGANLGTITAALMRLLAQTSAAEMQAAILEALQRGVPHPNAVRLALSRRRQQRGEPPPVGVALPAHLQARDTLVQPHALETYDQLKETLNASSDTPPAKDGS